MKHILSILLLLLAFTACGDKKAVTDVLNRAETLMNEHPDSSLTLLRTLTFDDFQKEKNRARYALLHSQALDKNYIDVTSDSLISVAVDYYKDKDDVRSKFLSYYYMGRVYANGERYLQATSCLMESEQLVDEVGDDYLSGLLYSEMGRIYRLYYDYPKSLEAYRKASECYERSGKIYHRNYMWYNQSHVYRNMDRNDEGEQLLRKIMESATEENDKGLLRSCLGDLVMLYIKQGKMKEARELYEKWESIVGLQSASSSFMAELALMYAEEGNFNQAQSFIQEGWKHVTNRMDSVSLSLSSAKIHYIQGKGMTAYEEVVKGMSLQNRGVRQALRQPVLTVQRDYLSEKLEYEAYRLQMEKRMRVLYLLMSLLLLVMIAYVSYRKLRTIKEKSQKTIDDLNNELLIKDLESRRKISCLLQELEDKDQTASSTIRLLRNELEKQQEDYALYVNETEKFKREVQDALLRKSALVADLFKKWFASMSKLVLALNQKDGKEENKNKKIRNEINLWQEKYHEGNKGFRELERLVNQYNDDAMRHFRNEIQWENEKDYRRVCCFFAGVSIRLIAIMMDEKEDAVYQNRYRLRKFLENSNSLHKDFYLMLLDK